MTAPRSEETRRRLREIDRAAYFIIGSFWVGAVLVFAAVLFGCEAPAPADHTAPDLGECAHLSATLHDAGPVAHVVVYPNGHPCGDGGTCQRGACE